MLSNKIGKIALPEIPVVGKELVRTTETGCSYWERTASYVITGSLKIRLEI